MDLGVLEIWNYRNIKSLKILAFSIVSKNVFRGFGRGGSSQ